MDLQDFYDRVEQAPTLKGLGIDDKGDGVHLLIDACDGQPPFKLPVETILKNEWEDIYAVLIGARDPNPLSHMTRVVGYFSRVENWNRSKLGELTDRQKGNYAIS